MYRLTHNASGGHVNTFVSLHLVYLAFPMACTKKATCFSRHSSL